MKPDPNASEPAVPATQDISLLAKDIVREFRFSARQGARRLVNQLVKTGEHAPRWAPPLGQVAQFAADVANGLDSMAVQLVSGANDYRHMQFRLLAVNGEDERSLFRATARTFQHNFYWVIKHLLRRAQRADVTVREEALHRAWQLLQGDSHVVDEPSQQTPAPSDEQRAMRLAHLTWVLCRVAPLHLHHNGYEAGAPEGDAEASFVVHMVAAAVIAGEVAATYPGATVQEEVQHSLQVAECVAGSRLANIQRALNSKQPLMALADEWMFVLRHI